MKQMTEEVISDGDRFHWIDVVEPSHEELIRIAEKYGLHPTSVQDCLDPEHLPKNERIGALSFVILRAYDDESSSDADTIQELTRKTAVFFTETFIITIHRKDQSYFVKLREKWKASRLSEVESPVALIFSEILQAVIATYECPIDRALDELERLEMGVFEARGSKPFEIKQGYFLKRKAFVFKRLLRLTNELLPKMTAHLASDPQRMQDIREQMDALHFYADELMENINGLLNLHLSLASHRTNEVMRILTVFSVFLLPLNLVTGIYGMNFEHMPELKWKWGYPFALASMVAVLLAVYLWFRRRGWLK